MSEERDCGCGKGDGCQDDTVPRTVPNRRVALSVRFRRWSRRSPLECMRCGASVVNARAHAMWHAAIEAGALRIPEDPGQTERSPREEFRVHVGEDGWPLS